MANYTLKLNVDPIKSENRIIFIKKTDNSCVYSLAWYSKQAHPSNSIPWESAFSVYSSENINVCSPDTVNVPNKWSISKTGSNMQAVAQYDPSLAPGATVILNKCGDAFTFSLSEDGSTRNYNIPSGGSVSVFAERRSRDGRMAVPASFCQSA